ncbi:hypothetical protein EIN_073970 [Entamoeba invadens IP1]|uniref:Uncharacterized protein n=1 Tax=Entamoeba invadens IP1 TaxID=370355 RepID=A0A0A1UBI3_ENTIV|nr:hypothetical protein EIN_073970 [Entamoeba invadens IP1]ELP92574.1 hypothetical protein EIN_073970 [Entamoeba invadens IP1]|eukprot:XP_004259345.1 hypothetical protein EIN_073970 [Entamoeba invadens IP1]
MGCGGSNAKVIDKLIPTNPDWKFSDSIKVEDNRIVQYKDHGSLSSCVGKNVITSISVKMMPSQSYLFVGLMELNASKSYTINSDGVMKNAGVYGLGMKQDEVIMNGVTTHYKRPTINNNETIELKYQNDRIMFKIKNEWDLLYVVGEGKQFVFVCEMCHLHSRVEILDTNKELLTGTPPK